MRRLGAHLGVEGMALYHYIHGREDLLDGIVELVIDDLYGDPDVHLTATHWQDYLQRLAHGVRRIALAHPQVFPLVATRPPAAPWVRPPLRSLRWMESFLETLHQCGFTDAGCVAAYRAFSSFLLGHLLLEVSDRGADVSPIEQADPDDATHHRPEPVPAVEKPGTRTFPGPLGRRIRRSPGNPARPHRPARPPLTRPQTHRFTAVHPLPDAVHDHCPNRELHHPSRPDWHPTRTERLTMTEGFRSPPPPSPAAPGGWGDTPRAAGRKSPTPCNGSWVRTSPHRPHRSPRHPRRRPVAIPPRPRRWMSPSSRLRRSPTPRSSPAPQVAGTVKEQAGQVTEEAKHQAKQLLSQAQSELSDQAASTQQRVSEGLHALADELTGMARNSEQDGVATDLARQAADRARTAAGWLADRDPGSLLNEVRSFARRKPGTYLALALGAGVLAGRLTRGLTAPTRRRPRRFRRQQRLGQYPDHVSDTVRWQRTAHRPVRWSADHDRDRLRDRSRPGAAGRSLDTGQPRQRRQRQHRNPSRSADGAMSTPADTGPPPEQTGRRPVAG